MIAVDGSEAMVEKAKERLGDRADYLVSDLVELELHEPVDLVFSTATFHWIPDHDRLFRSCAPRSSPAGASSPSAAGTATSPTTPRRSPPSPPTRSTGST